MQHMIWIGGEGGERRCIGSGCGWMGSGKGAFLRWYEEAWFLPDLGVVFWNRQRVLSGCVVSSVPAAHHAVLLSPSWKLGLLGEKRSTPWPAISLPAAFLCRPVHLAMRRATEASLLRTPLTCPVGTCKHEGSSFFLMNLWSTGDSRNEKDVTMPVPTGERLEVISQKRWSRQFISCQHVDTLLSR